MPTRATKRGDERTPLDGRVRRPRSAARASPGSRSPASSPAPARGCWSSTATRSASARRPPARRRPSGSRRWASPPRSARRSTRWSSTRRTRRRLPPPVDVLDLRLPGALRAALRPVRRRVRDREGRGPRSGSATARSRRDRSRRRRSAPLVVDALGWKRVLAGNGYQPPDAPLSRGLEVHPHGRQRRARDLDRPRLRARRLRLELPGPRRGPDRRRLVRPALPRQGADRAPRRGPRLARRCATRATGSPTSSAPATDGRDLLRRRLGRPLPAADRGGDPDRLLLRDRLRARAARGDRGPHDARGGAARATRAFSDAHEWKFKWMLRTQRLVPRVPAAAARRSRCARMERKRFVDWSFGHYLRIAPPSFARARLAGAADVPVAA